MKYKTVKELATRLNEIMVERDKMEIKMKNLDREYNDIIRELWSRMPHLINDTNLELKKVKS